MKRSRIGRLAPRLAIADIRTAPPAPKDTDPHYHSAEHAAWRKGVCDRAGWRCEWVDDNGRCTKASPLHTVFADHIVELQDGGAALDPANGQCLCGQHHTIKTNMAKRAREARRDAGG
jgi:5-methylcytosine-specific restriction protein A